MSRSFLNRRSMMSLMATALVAPIAGAATAPRIVATTPLLADCAHRLCGAVVTALIPAETAAQSYRASRADTALLAQADLVLWHGPGVEAEMTAHLTRLARSRPVVALDAADHWPALVPTHRAEMVHALAATLAAHFPQLAARSTEQAAQLAADLSALDARCAAHLAAPVANRRRLLTTSPALAAFGAAYGLEPAAPPNTQATCHAFLAQMAASGDSKLFITDPDDAAAQALVALAPHLTRIHLPLKQPLADHPDLAEQIATSLALHLASASQPERAESLPSRA
ncbi:Zinc-uptake complex component A, substrate-binding [Gemmobacter aquatilis]|uniref:Zinc-uptake complex component A, substrate-binding n=1 Tax=Gemmobacter aquatilis TaxID=933059 RepID=A0A1H8HTW0_9RHOB|nr:metal ABC transporter substrate-binding protein [Gemmobacter aquatilis]SEN59445.1 Zinc-uptake complex component A, substrate-binding [Gemmobacter aquatilis]